MGRLERIREAELEARQAALQRWKERAGQREKNRAELATAGVGAADSPMLQARFSVRQAAFEQARALRAQGQLPIALERKIGPTLDWTPFAPSVGASKAGRPVARLVNLGGPGTQPEGFATGFMVSPQLLLTNHHVFPSLADVRGTGANFLFERTDRGLQTGVVFEMDGDTFYHSNERLDLALVAVKPKALTGEALTGFGNLTLVEATPKILIGQPVNIIQYPEGGEKEYAIAQNRLIDLLDSGFLHYETDTLEGSSGSPAYSNDWQLVGLHHASIPEMDGEHVVAVGGGYWEPGMPDDKVHWIANEGIRISAIVKYLGGVQMPNPTQQALLADLLNSSTDPVDDLANEMKKPDSGITPVLTGPGAAVSPLAAANNTFTFNGPVTMHVYAPAMVGALNPQPVPPVQPDVAVEKVMRFDPDYDNREGYDPQFLDPADPDLEVPAPTIGVPSDGAVLTNSDGTPLVLKYHHYELVMNKERRLLMWTADNVDYDPKVKSNLARDAFGKDKWMPDPRIPANVQLMDPDFYKPAGNIDRGHIVRREDNAWGNTDTEIEFANSDTFHWTNCTPQHEAFNQSNPGMSDKTYKGMKGLWGDFENYIQTSLKGDDTRACILAGPVLDPRDPSHDFGLGDIKYPLQFWKVVAVPTTDDAGARKLAVYGFLLSQADVVGKFGIEVFRPGEFKKLQVSLASITAMTGVVFAPHLHAADPLAGSEEKVEITDGSEVRHPEAAAAADAAPAKRARKQVPPRNRD